jgi:anti-anti-sigma regulatory factor
MPAGDVVVVLDGLVTAEAAAGLIRRAMGDATSGTRLVIDMAAVNYDDDDVVVVLGAIVAAIRAGADAELRSPPSRVRRAIESARLLSAIRIEP